VSNKILCKKCNSIFDKWEDRPVIWSADTLPCCPVCGECGWTGNYEYIESE
jgi:RNase P subunit RPR2